VWVTSSLANVLTPTSVALGNFDGIHRGHQQVIQTICPGGNQRPTPLRDNSLTSTEGYGKLRVSLETQAGLLQPKCDGRSYATVVTFNPHPQEFFTGESRTLLTPLDERTQLLEALGVQQLVLLPFDRELACLSPEAFVEKILVQQLKVEYVSVGFDFCFGFRRAGTAADLEAIAAAYGIQVNIISPQTCEGERISSSAIRRALQQGNLQRANQLLGRPYRLVGQVVPGQQLGQTLGFPTANLQLPAEKFLPCQGVYGVRVQSPLLGLQIGVMNLGCRPTVNGVNQTAEVHLLDWSGDLYGQTLVVYLEQFLRPEQKFNSLEDLKAQIDQDCRVVRSYLEPVV